MTNEISQTLTLTEDEIIEKLPLSLERYTKKIKGIHNLVNKLLIITDGNCEYMKTDIPIANKWIRDQSKYLSTGRYLFELISVKIDEVLDINLEFFATPLNQSKCYKQEELDFYTVDVKLRHGIWEVSSIKPF